jgi:hypothetical protein
MKRWSSLGLKGKIVRVVMAVVVLDVVLLAAFGSIDGKANQEEPNMNQAYTEEQLTSGLLVLCSNWFNDQITNPDCKLHNIMGVGGIWETDDHYKVVIDATLVDSNGAKDKRPMGFYISKDFRPGKELELSLVQNVEIL